MTRGKQEIFIIQRFGENQVQKLLDQGCRVVLATGATGARIGSGEAFFLVVVEHPSPEGQGPFR